MHTISANRLPNADITKQNDGDWNGNHDNVAENHIGPTSKVSIKPVNATGGERTCKQQYLYETTMAV